MKYIELMPIHVTIQMTPFDCLPPIVAPFLRHASQQLQQCICIILQLCIRLNKTLCTRSQKYGLTTKSRCNDFLHCIQPEHALHSFHPGTASKDVAAVLESLATKHQTVAPGTNKNVIQDRHSNAVASNYHMEAILGYRDFH